MWFQTKTKVKTKTWAGDQTPPASRPRYPGKRTRREEDHALLIVHDEFRTGYSLIGLLASRAPLRFTGIVRISYGQNPEKELYRTVNCVFSPCLTQGVHPFRAVEEPARTQTEIGKGPDRGFSYRSRGKTN
jgi:hypothetical protein